jgi:ABC-type glycerol-3-phosphate transport system substrate-binding protein
MPRRLAIAVSLAILAFAAGCPDRTPSPAAPTSPAAKTGTMPLQVLVVDDQPLGVAIARQWKSRTEGALDIRPITREELLSASRLPGDVVVFPAGYVGHLVERELIVPLDDQPLAGSEFDRRDIFDQVRLRDIAWGNRTVAVPLGSPQLLLAYRPDVLEAHGIAPPSTWGEYQQAIDKLTSSESKNRLPELAAIEPTADGWAGQSLLARAAAYVTHRDQVSPLFNYATLDPLLTAKPYERALAELVAAHQGTVAHEGTVADREFTPEQAFQELEAGRAAMAITWAPPTPTRQAAEPGKIPIAFRPLPGANEVFNFARKSWEPRGETEDRHVPLLATTGRLAAVTSTTASAREAQSLLVWLAGREVSPLVSPASGGTTLFRESQMADARRWTGGLPAKASQSYAAALKQSASLPRYLSLRLPGREEYLAVLDAAVRSALAGEQTPAEALAAASDKWKAITAEIGVEKQRRALARDLGLQSLP